MAQETSKGKSGLAIPARNNSYGSRCARDGKRASVSFRSGDSMQFSNRSRIVGNPSFTRIEEGLPVIRPRSRIKPR